MTLFLESLMYSPANLFRSGWELLLFSLYRAASRRSMKECRTIQRFMRRSPKSVRNGTWKLLLPSETPFMGTRPGALGSFSHFSYSAVFVEWMRLSSHATSLNVLPSSPRNGCDEKTLFTPAFFDS